MAELGIYLPSAMEQYEFRFSTKSRSFWSRKSTFAAEVETPAKRAISVK